MIEQQFLECCLEHKQILIPPDIEQWKSLLDFCVRQSIVGVGFYGIEKMSQKPPKDLLLQWIALSELIKKRNILLNKRCVELAERLQQDGFDYCILKGQGNSLLYPYPVSRTPGDIDIWMKPKKRDRRLEAGDIINYVKGRNPKGRAEYHHIDFGEFNGVEVEAHYRPTFMNNLITNRRLQRWMKERESEQFNNLVSLPGLEQKISVPTWDFNVVFQLSHIYRHVIQGGIGLRQMIDYYYLLKSNANRPNDTNCYETLKYLGLMEIAGAVMWVMKEVLGLEDQYLIAPVDKRRGRFLYREIMNGGNFGQYNADGRRKQVEGGVKKNINRLKRDIRLLCYFPSECLWEPVFRVYHYFWRLKYN